MIHANLMSYLGFDFVIPALVLTVIPACLESFFRESSWASQDHRELEDSHPIPNTAGTRAGVTEKEMDCGGHLLRRSQ